MEFIKYLRPFLFAMILHGCGITTELDKIPTNTDGEIKTGLLTGSVTDLDGKFIELAAGSSKIQILLFVSETCAICRKETTALVQLRSTRGVPLNVDFLSIVVGSIAADAADWKNSLGVNWNVAIDSNDPLFRNYCPEQQTPCLVMRNPFLNQFKTLTGEHSISEWETFTGAWVY